MFCERLTIQDWVPSAFFWIEFWHPGVVGPDLCYTINRTDRVRAASIVEHNDVRPRVSAANSTIAQSHRNHSLWRLGALGHRVDFRVRLSRSRAGNGSLTERSEQ